jgi:hypothetical protein
MNALRKVLVVLITTFLSSAYAVVSASADVDGIINAAANQYTASQNLQRVVQICAYRIPAKWIAVFNQQGKLIVYNYNMSSHSHHQSFKRIDHEVVAHVLRTGQPVIQRGSRHTANVEFYPVKIDEKTIAVIEVVR